MALEWVKTIETPTTIEVWEYSAPAGRMNPEARRDDDSEDESERGRKPDAAAYYDAAKRRQRHYRGVRWEIARLIDCNFDDSTKFLTLTFADNVTDIKYCNREFRKFIKRLNRRVYGTDKTKVRYLAVWEAQKRGAIHYHVVLFGNLVNVDQRYNVGRYISKYFSKDVDEGSYKQKKFFRSQNLIQPVEERFTTLQPLSFEGYTVAFTKEYDQLIPDLYGEGGGYAPRKVRYTKIGKDW